jgi:hypothetical protein
MASEAPPTETMVSEAPPTQTLIPTYTSEPEETPTPADTSTPTPSATPDTPQAKFLKDITIPDGTVMEPGQAFTKTWRFQNIGSVPWGEGIKIVFVPGKQKGFESKQMGGPDWAPVANVAPGKNVDISVDLAAPKQLGHHRSYWRLQLANGDWLETIHYADIYVASKEPLDPGEKGTEFKVKIEGKWVTWTQPCGSPLPPGATCVCDCVTAPLPGKAGEVPPGENGGTITGPGGETRWLPCGSEIPPGWTCTCNCVSVPAACTCDQVCTCDTVCSCVGHTVCTCDQIHYWYPN